MARSDTSARVAVLGMGNMGRALAGRLADLGYSPLVWNRSQRDLTDLYERGARPLRSLASLWSEADIAVSFVADDDALRSVCLGPEGLLREPVHRGLFIEMSTVSPATSEEIARGADGAGIAYLRSPVSGNPNVLAEGNLTLVVSGPRDVFEGAEPLLSAMGRTVVYVGEGERARLVKLAINAGLAITTELLAELVVLTESHGLDRATFLGVLGRSVLGSPFVQYKTAALNQRDYRATFTTSLLAKDLHLALDLADEAELTLPVVALVTSLVDDAVSGFGDVDFAALLPYLQLAHGHEPDIEPGPG